MTVSYDEVLGRLASGEIAMIYGATEILTSIEESYPDADFLFLIRRLDMTTMMFLHIFQQRWELL